MLLRHGVGMMPFLCRVTRWPACLWFYDGQVSVSCVKRTELGRLLRIRRLGLIVLGLGRKNG